jgi:hypothetical protein
MRAPKQTGGPQSLLWDLLTFERLMTGPVMHLIYWCGLGLIALAGFGVVGAAIGVAIRGGGWEGPLLSIPVLVGGLLMMGAMVLLWRGACEFFLAVFQIAEDLQALRRAAEKDVSAQRRAIPPASDTPFKP